MVAGGGFRAQGGAGEAARMAPGGAGYFDEPLALLPQVTNEEGAILTEKFVELCRHVKPLSVCKGRVL